MLLLIVSVPALHYLCFESSVKPTVKPALLLVVLSLALRSFKPIAAKPSGFIQLAALNLALGVVHVDTDLIGSAPRATEGIC